jgi:hypothetical protein
MGRKLTGKKPRPATIRQRRWRAKVKRAALMPNANGNEWYTPDRYIALVRAALGTIDCDPASNDIAQQTVRAIRYYTAADDGLSKEWTGNVFMNPPFQRELIIRFANKLLAELTAGHCTAAIVLLDSQTSAAWFQRLLTAVDAVCYPDHRVRCLANGKDPGRPRISQTFLYFGPEPARFAVVFSAIGHVTGTRMT